MATKESNPWPWVAGLAAVLGAGGGLYVWKSNADAERKQAEERAKADAKDEREALERRLADAEAARRREEQARLTAYAPRPAVQALAPAIPAQPAPAPKPQGNPIADALGGLANQALQGLSGALGGVLNNAFKGFKLF